MLERREGLKHGKKRKVFGALKRLRSDESIFYGESVVSDIPWQGAQATLIVIRDITERQAIEDQLRQSQKMEAVGQLTGGVAHEFNNLLAVIIGNLDVAQEKDAGDQDIAGNLAQAMKAADRSADLTKQLLAFSRKQALMPRPTDLNDSMSGFLDLLRPTLGETIEVEGDIARDLWLALVDPKQMESAILSLALNGRDAMPGGGKLTIEAANVRLSSNGLAGDAGIGPGDYVMLSVTDTGTGMPPEVMEHVFEPFYTTKEVGQGTGLGLSMVHGFVKQSDGHIEVVSEVGAGTTFKIYLPRATEAPAEIS